MQDLAKHVVATDLDILSASAPPKMSRSLRLEVERLADPDPAARALRRFDPHSVDNTDREEAANILEQLRHCLEPVDRKQLLYWTGQLNMRSINPQDETTFKLKFSVIAEDCGGLPKICFTKETALAVHLKVKFFPCPADILNVLDPIAQHWRRSLLALERIAKPVPTPLPSTVGEPKQRRRTEQELAHVAGCVATIHADIAARAREREAKLKSRMSENLGVPPEQPASELTGTMTENKNLQGTTAKRPHLLEQNIEEFVKLDPEGD